MNTEHIDRRRRGLIVQGASLLGMSMGGTMLSSLAGCENNKVTPGINSSGQPSKYLQYKDRLDRCFSAVFQDVMDAMNVRAQCMDPKIKPLVPTMNVWGEAVTIYLETVNEVPEKPFQLEMELLDDTKEGQLKPFCNRNA